MGKLPDSLRLSELSIPGTHESMALYDPAGTPLYTQCQSLSLPLQLFAGIRALDIRCRLDGDHFKISHGDEYQFAEFRQDVLNPVIEFLREYPTETVLMRIQPTGTQRVTLWTFWDMYTLYMTKLKQDGYEDYIWQRSCGEDTNPTLGEVRGKIVVLNNFYRVPDDPNVYKYGLYWGSFKIQDDFELPSRIYMVNKVNQILYTLIAAGDMSPPEDPNDPDNREAIYVNFLSGTCMAGGDITIYPWFVASGHGTYHTDGNRLPTGATWSSCTGCSITGYCPYFFPEVACVCSGCPCETCTEAYEGTNEIVTNWMLNELPIVFGKRSGIIMADFPGPILIDQIIQLNPWYNATPQADAGGPYAGVEGSPITFDAGGSTDAEGTPLRFRWDFDNDEEWETEYSTDPTATYTWFDDWSGTVKVEVYDGYSSARATADVTVSNAAPTVDAGPDQTVNEGELVSLAPATFADEGVLDTHAATISWGDGTASEAGVVSESPATVSGTHVYADNGSYTVTVCVTDDDGGTTCDDLEVTVNNVPPTAEVDSITDETGAEIGVDVPVGLVGLVLDVSASFNDLGTLDSHTATFDWDDGTALEAGLVAESPFGPPGDTAGMDGSVSGSHIYMTPGVYYILLTVTDDDGQPGTAGQVFGVVTGMVALEKAIADLKELAEDHDPNSEAAAKIQDAVDKLNGQKGGQARNGAIDLLNKRNLNATLEKIKQALQCLEAAEAADATLDLTYCKGLLTLIAKSVAVEAVAQAEAAISKPNDTEKVELAMQLLVQGDGSLTALDHVGAVAFYQKAVRAI